MTEEPAAPDGETEIEAKLLAPDPSVLDALAARSSIGRFQLRPAENVSLHSTYLDTPDRTLSRNAIALRLRSKPTGYEMTAKWGGSVRGDVHERREITAALDGAPARPITLPSGRLRETLGRWVGENPLEAIAVIEIERRTFDVVDSTSSRVAELALDIVRHSAPRAGAQFVAYCEVEIESTGGGPEVVGEIAALLRRELALQPTSETKFSRAMRDLEGDG